MSLTRRVLAEWWEVEHIEPVSLQDTSYRLRRQPPAGSVSARSRYLISRKMPRHGVRRMLHEASRGKGGGVVGAALTPIGRQEGSVMRLILILLSFLAFAATTATAQEYKCQSGGKVCYGAIPMSGL